MDSDTVDSRRSAAPLLLASTAFVLTLFLFAPARIALGNFKEFSTPFPETILFFLAVSVVLVGILFGVLALTCRRPGARRVAVSLLLACALLMWVQGSILPWRYGVLDGKDIAWGALAGRGAAETAAWAVLAAASVIWARQVFRASRVAGLLLVVVQLLSAAQTWIVTPKDQGFKQQERETDTLFQFSPHVNVIVLVLDTFQSDIFQDIIRDDAELAARFDGFTYFRNALAGSDGTLVSVPNMLTATNYDNSVPYLEYVKSAFLENSLPKTLHEYSFRIDAYPIFPYSIHTDFSASAPPALRLRDWDAFFEDQAFIADLALFRVSPHFAKRLIYNRQQWRISAAVKRLTGRGDRAQARAGSGQSGLSYAREFENSRELVRTNWDASFIQKMIPASGTMQDADTFKFYHLNGIHLQLVMNEDLLADRILPTRAGMLRQGKGVLKIAAIFLDRLRQLGVYDNSLIFVVADHGAGIPDALVNVSPLAAQFNTGAPYKGNFSPFKAAGIPMVLVKRMNGSGAMKLSDAPICLGDIPQTVVEELGLQARFPGRSMFSVQDGEQRERIYRAFVGPQEDVDFLAPLCEYAVNGFSWDDASWRETGAVYYSAQR
jgi:hypothetical protein